MRMPKIAVTRLRDPMSMVPVFKEPQPQQLDKPMIFESGNLKLSACLQKRTNCPQPVRENVCGNIYYCWIGVVEIGVQNRNLSNVSCSFNTINLWQGEISILATRGEHQGIATHQGER